MKRTLLRLVQDILSSLDSDEVNSISDTVESEQVARIIRTTFEDIVARANLRDTWVLFELNASQDITKPTLMYKPSTIENIKWIKYNKEETLTESPMFREVYFVDLETFLDRMYRLDSSSEDTKSFTHTINDSSIDFLCKTKKHPEYFTTFDDNTLIFDSYHSDYDVTLVKNKTMGYGQLVTSFSMTDDFIPPLDNKNFSLLYNEAKSLAWAELKQTVHQKAEQAAKRGWVTLQKSRDDIPVRKSQLDRLPDYSRGK